MKFAGTYDGGIIGSPNPAASRGKLLRINDAAVASGQAFLESELEKRDPLVREPLSNYTYPRDIPVKTGGGWVDTVSAIGIDYGVSGGSDDGLVSSGNVNQIPVIQANFEQDKFSAHAFQLTMRIGYIDMQRANLIGRNLDKLLTDGVRTAYDKHMDANTYVGVRCYGTFGLLNNPEIAATQVTAGVNGKLNFKSKTADEILADINTLISDTWEQAENDLAALPNHIIMPFEQYNYIATKKVSELADKTILAFILENNITSQNGGDLFIGATSYCKGAGTGGSDRMACYVHHDRFVSMEELVPMSRTMTGVNIDTASYDSIYMANISQVEFFYHQTFRYADGI